MARRRNPIFPEELTVLSARMAVQREGRQVTYLIDGRPHFCHAFDDLPTFRWVTGQSCALGIVTPAAVARVFGVSKLSVQRGVRISDLFGVLGFVADHRGELPEEACAMAQELLDQHLDVAEVARRLGQERGTVTKAIRQGQLRKPQRED